MLSNDLQWDSEDKEDGCNSAVLLSDLLTDHDPTTPSSIDLSIDTANNSGLSSGELGIDTADNSVRSMQTENASQLSTLLSTTTYNCTSTSHLLLPLF